MGDVIGDGFGRGTGLALSTLFHLMFNRYTRFEVLKEYMLHSCWSLDATISLVHKAPIFSKLYLMFCCHMNSFVEIFSNPCHTRPYYCTPLTN
jgi:hypothetical protein